MERPSNASMSVQNLCVVNVSGADWGLEDWQAEYRVPSYLGFEVWGLLELGAAGGFKEN